jgi:hypothetical protein
MATARSRWVSSPYQVTRRPQWMRLAGSRVPRRRAVSRMRLGLMPVQAYANSGVNSFLEFFLEPVGSVIWTASPLRSLCVRAACFHSGLLLNRDEGYGGWPTSEATLNPQRVDDRFDVEPEGSHSNPRSTVLPLQTSMNPSAKPAGDRMTWYGRQRRPACPPEVEQWWGRSWPPSLWRRFQLPRFGGRFSQTGNNASIRPSSRRTWRNQLTIVEGTCFLLEKHSPVRLDRLWPASRCDSGLTDKGEDAWQPNR